MQLKSSALTLKTTSSSTYMQDWQIQSNQTSLSWITGLRAAVLQLVFTGNIKTVLDSASHVKFDISKLPTLLVLFLWCFGRLVLLQLCWRIPFFLLHWERKLRRQWEIEKDILKKNREGMDRPILLSLLCGIEQQSLLDMESDTVYRCMSIDRQAEREKEEGPAFSGPIKLV